MFCTQCGSEIKDGFKFCPECGNAVVQNTPSDNRSEIDRAADEIAEWCPSQVNGVKALREKTNLDLKTARDIMALRYSHGMAQNLQDGKCPKCGSNNISYDKMPDRSSTVSFFSGVYSTTHRNGKIKAKCEKCGNSWKI